ncbi:uncharacterized protein LOC133893170 [Phragmites australis]|uniref:uncharacterized protein LOC133893170 n=1 Tax=Phragmites australis TaxID=29695 RepID=UPI002D799FE0|nr:uncharacterized protein LOC133893170 [Phragmites australis]
MAKAWTAVLVLVALSVPFASAAAAGYHGRPKADEGGPGRGFFGMPWFGPQPRGFFGGWGAGVPGYRRGAVVPPSTVCAEQGPCHGKRLTCPAKCFKSFSYGGKHGGGGGGGGGCSFDCSRRCVASC